MVALSLEWSDYVKAKHDLAGPYEIEFLGEAREQQFKNSCGQLVRTFAVRIIAADGEVLVFRRFEQLQVVVRAMSTGAAVRKRGIGYLLSKSCRESAARELFRYVQAALQEDRFCRHPALRDFLALDPLFIQAASCLGWPYGQEKSCEWSTAETCSSVSSIPSISRPSRLMSCALSQKFK
jgi:hypothetical protein